MRKFFGKRRKYSNQRGATLVEAVVSIALIGLLSIIVTSLFFSLSKISKLSSKQQELNGIIRVVHDNVINSARNGTDIEGNDGYSVSKAHIHEEMVIKDLSNTVYEGYYFVLDYEGADSYGSSTKTVDKYKVTINTTDDKYVTAFCIEIYP